jgi:hypothetical protein
MSKINAAYILPFSSSEIEGVLKFFPVYFVHLCLSAFQLISKGRVGSTTEQVWGKVEFPVPYQVFICWTVNTKLPSRIFYAYESYMIKYKEEVYIITNMKYYGL